MSTYDFLVVKLRVAATSPADITEDNVVALGSFAGVQAALRGVFPDVDFDTDDGHLKRGHSRFDFETHDDPDAVRSIWIKHWLAAPGSSDFTPVWQLCAALGVVAFDTARSRLITGAGDLP